MGGRGDVSFGEIRSRMVCSIRDVDRSLLALL